MTLIVFSGRGQVKECSRFKRKEGKRIIENSKSRQFFHCEREQKNG